MAAENKHFVPMDKRSKKEQKAFHASKRGSWNGVVPTTRVIESGKRYVRTKAKATARREGRGAEND